MDESCRKWTNTKVFYFHFHSVLFSDILKPDWSHHFGIVLSEPSRISTHVSMFLPAHIIVPSSANHSPVAGVVTSLMASLRATRKSMTAITVPWGIPFSRKKLLKRCPFVLIWNYLQSKNLIIKAIMSRCSTNWVDICITRCLQTVSYVFSKSIFIMFAWWFSAKALQIIFFRWLRWS